MKQGQMGAGMVALIIFGSLALFAFIGIMLLIGGYNSLVGYDTATANAWGKVQSAYQRRVDLIPNLVETVKGAKNFEQDTLTKITQLRSEAGQAKVNIENAQDAESLQAADSQMNSVLSRLLVIVENYPDLKSVQNFRDLQVQIEGTENRVKYERDEYNNAVMGYQRAVRSFPTVIIAGIFGFNGDKWKTFKADEGAQNAPKVSFE